MGEVIRRPGLECAPDLWPEALGRAAAGGKTDPGAGEASEIYQGNGSGREALGEVFKNFIDNITPRKAAP